MSRSASTAASAFLSRARWSARRVLGSCQPCARQSVWAMNSASTRPPAPVLMARWLLPAGVRSFSMRAGEALNLPEHGAPTIVIFVGLQRVDQQPFLAVGTESCVDGEGDPEFGCAGQQVQDRHRITLAPREVLYFGIGDKNDIEIGAVVEFCTAEFAQANDGERRAFQFVFAQDNFERVLQAGVGERGKFGEGLFEAGQTKNIAQADAQ